MLSILLFVLIIIFLAVVSSFIPIGNENSTVRRLPWITFSIMAINVVIFFVSFPVVAGQQEELQKLGSQIEVFLKKNPEILADEKVRDKLSEIGFIPHLLIRQNFRILLQEHLNLTAEFLEFFLLTRNNGKADEEYDNIDRHYGKRNPGQAAHSRI